MSNHSPIIQYNQLNNQMPVATTGYGPHLTYDGYECDPKPLNDMKKIFDFLSELPQIIKMRPLTRPYVLSYDGGDIPADYGVTGVVIIAESHMSIHTYPHDRVFFLDIFSCKEFDVEMAKKFIRETFKAKKEDTALVIRGRHFRPQPANY